MQDSEYKPLTIGDWIVTQLILAIPLVGLIMLFVWGFDSGTHPSKKTYCQAMLIFIGCIFALGIVIMIVALAVGASFGHALQQSQPSLQ